MKSASEKNERRVLSRFVFVCLLTFARCTFSLVFLASFANKQANR